MTRFILLTLVLAFFSTINLSAQITAKAVTTSDNSPSAMALNDWSIYADAESQVYFVDFEQIAVNVNTIVVRSNEGAILLEEDVFDLPVNSIYELDFSQYADGNYIIELQAFTGTIRKEVAHRK